jgi:hypothetical protein
MKTVFIGMSLVVFVSLFQSCGKAHSGSSRAEIIPAPLSGYTCFLIRGDDGNSIGGNCVKE